MKVSQSRLQQKSTSNQTVSNIHTIFKSVYTGQEVSQLQRSYLNLCRINSFLFVLLRAQKTIFSQSVTKNLHCLPTNNVAVKLISTLDGVQIKNVIMKNICNYIEEFKKQRNILKQNVSHSLNSFIGPKHFNNEEKEKLTNLYLSELMQDLKNSLTTQYNDKVIYAYINFKWTSNFIRTFIFSFDNHPSDLAQLQNSIEQLELEIRNLINPKSNQVIYDKMDTTQLLTHIPNKNIAQLLMKQFNKINTELKSKEKECQTLKVQLKQSAEIIKAQIQFITTSEQQKLSFQEKIIFSQSQLQILNKKCSSIQKELQRLNLQITNLKLQPSQYRKGYYMNSKWQKLQQKLFVEVVQLESDLLMQREQIRNLVNIFLEEIKVTHDFFNDLRASKFTIYRFDREMIKLMRTTSAFDKINLEQHLTLKQESLRSESSPEMYKSTISTYSEAETEGKMRNERQIMQFEITQQECKQQ